MGQHNDASSLGLSHGLPKAGYPRPGAQRPRRWSVRAAVVVRQQRPRSNRQNSQSAASEPVDHGRAEHDHQSPEGPPHEDPRLVLLLAQPTQLDQVARAGGLVRGSLPFAVDEDGL